MADEARKQLFGHSSPPTEGTGGGCVVLFSLPFIGVGVFAMALSLGYIPSMESGIKGPHALLTVFGAVFCLAGLGLWGVGLSAIAGARAALKRRREHPNEPWYWDHAWNPQFAESGGPGTALQGLAVGAFLVLFLSMFNFIAFFSGKSDVPFFVKGIVGFFDLIALLVIGSAFYALFQYFKYGKSRLHFARFPFRPGNTLEGGLEGSRRLFQANAIVLTLRYIEEVIVTTGSGKNRNTSVSLYTLHEVRQEIDPRQLNPDSDLGIPISIRLPEGMPTLLHDKPRRYWELDVSADTPGIDYSARFIIPVYGDEPRDDAERRPPG